MLFSLATVAGQHKQLVVMSRLKKTLKVHLLTLVKCTSDSLNFIQPQTILTTRLSHTLPVLHILPVCKRITEHNDTSKIRTVLSSICFRFQFYFSCSNSRVWFPKTIRNHEKKIETVREYIAYHCMSLHFLFTCFEIVPRS